MTKHWLGVLFVLILGVLAYARESVKTKSIDLPQDNPMAELKPGPGVERVRANCVMCHSTDYIVRQPGGSREKWQAEVKRMIEAFGAPISAQDAEVIAEYLASTYAPQPNPPRAEPARGPVTRKRPEKLH